MARPPCPSPTVRLGTHLRVGGRRTEAHEVRPTRTVPRDLRSLPATQPRTGCPAGIRGDESGVASESLGGNRDREGLRPSRRSRPVAIFDNHFHLRPEFLGGQAAEEFESVGGTAIMLT